MENYLFSLDQALGESWDQYLLMKGTELVAQGSLEDIKKYLGIPVEFEEVVPEVKHQKITLGQFISDVKNGFYIFGNDACDLCAEYEKLIKGKNIKSKITFVEVRNWELNNAKMLVKGLKGLPCSTFYVDGTLRAVINGEMLDNALTDFLEFGEKYGL